MLPVSDPAPAALLLAAEPLRSAELLARAAVHPSWLQDLSLLGRCCQVAVKGFPERAETGTVKQWRGEVLPGFYLEQLA